MPTGYHTICLLGSPTYPRRRFHRPVPLVRLPLLLQVLLHLLFGRVGNCSVRQQQPRGISRDAERWPGNQCV